MANSPSKRVRKRKSKTKPAFKMSFLKLPGEIKNRIYSYLCVQDAAILLRRIPVEERVNTYAFANARPPFADPPICKAVQKEVLSIFYEENKFVLTDGVMSPAAIITFEHLCGNSVGKITSIKVNARQLMGSVDLTVRFEARLCADGVRVFDSSGQDIEQAPHGWRLVVQIPSTSGKCFCNILDALAMFGKVTPAQLVEVAGGRLRNPIFAFLEAYSRDMDERKKAHESASRSNRGHHAQPTQRVKCERCGGCYYRNRARVTATDVEELARSMSSLSN